MKLRHEGPYITIDAATAKQVLENGRYVYMSHKSLRIGDIEPLVFTPLTKSPEPSGGGKWKIMQPAQMDYNTGKYADVPKQEFDDDKNDYRFVLGF